MRFLMCASAVCGTFLFSCTANVQANGPGGGGHGGPGGVGHASFTGGPAGGASHFGGFQGGSGGSGGPKWKPGDKPAGTANKADKLDLSDLHPNLGGGLNGSCGNCSRGNSAGTYWPCAGRPRSSQMIEKRMARIKERLLSGRGRGGRSRRRRG